MVYIILVSSSYDILGLDEDADIDDIKEAYRELVKEVHPDLGGNQEEFKRIQSAYEDLKNKEIKERINQIKNKSKKSSQPNKKEVTSATIEYLNYEIIEKLECDINDRNLFKKVKGIDLDEKDFGRFKVKKGETVLNAAERNGHNWPYSCRGGACANCAIYVVNGDVETPRYTILSDNHLNRNFRLSCIGRPLTENVKIIYNMKKIDELQELLLPES